MDKLFEPFASSGWYRCINCTEDVHKNLVWVSSITDELNSDHFCSEFCYLEYNDEDSGRSSTEIINEESTD